MRRLGILLVVLAVLAAVGVIVAQIGRDKPPQSSATSSGVGPRADTVPQPAEVLAAARAAGVAAVALTDEVVLAGFISRRELIESFTTSAYGPVLADETSTAVNAMLLELGERDVDPTDLHVVEQPITARAEAIGDSVRVEVWSVLVIAVPGTGPGRQVWRTVTLDMVKGDGRWLVDRWSSNPGPTPAPAAEAAFDDAVAFVDPLGWPTAVTSEVK